MYKCDTCGKYFDEPTEVNINLESFYGVSDLFDNYHYETYDACPYCNDISIDKMSLESYYEEIILNKEKEIADLKMEINIKNQIIERLQDENNTRESN